MIGSDKDMVGNFNQIFAALAPRMGTHERTSGREGCDPSGWGQYERGCGGDRSATVVA